MCIFFNIYFFIFSNKKNFFLSFSSLYFFLFLLKLIRLANLYTRQAPRQMKFSTVSKLFGVKCNEKLSTFFLKKYAYIYLKKRFGGKKCKRQTSELAFALIFIL